MLLLTIPNHRHAYASYIRKQRDRMRGYEESQQHIPVLDGLKQKGHIVVIKAVWALGFDYSLAAWGRKRCKVRREDNLGGDDLSIYGFERLLRNEQ
jgi:hypothetical protein